MRSSIKNVINYGKLKEKIKSFLGEIDIVTLYGLDNAEIIKKCYEESFENIDLDKI